MLKFNRQNLYSSRELVWFVVDFIMLGLLIFNLTWIILDSIYAIDAIENSIRAASPAIADFYHPIHQNFVFYDLVFVGIFLTEFFVRWADAVHRKIYDRWFFYPFIHWFDLVGCIPVSGARVLRLLRVFSILYRLHKYKIIDFTQTRIYKFALFYYDVLLEELTDRIVIKVLSGAQEELRHGSPLVHRVQSEILQPRKAMLVSWLSERVAEASQHAYLPNEQALRDYLENVVDDAMERNEEVRRIRQIPMVGNMVTESLEHAVGDIVAAVIHQILSDLSTGGNKEFIADLTEILLQSEEVGDGERTELESQFLEVMIEVLDAVKEQVAVQRWREKL